VRRSTEELAEGLRAAVGERAAAELGAREGGFVEDHEILGGDAGAEREEREAAAARTSADDGDLRHRGGPDQIAEGLHGRRHGPLRGATTRRDADPDPCRVVRAWTGTSTTRSGERWTRTNVKDANPRGRAGGASRGC